MDNVIKLFEKALYSDPVNLALCCVILSLVLVMFVIYLAWWKSR